MAKASIITNPVNLQYLTGFKSSRAFLLMTKTKTYLFTDGRYLERAKKIKAVTPVNLKDKEVFEKLRRKHHLNEIEYESTHLTTARLKGFKKRFKKCKWKEGSQKTEKKRAIKSTGELRKLVASQRLNEQIFYSIKRALKTGVTELQIAKKIKILALENNADIAFEPIVAFGNHSSVPHHENSKRKLKKGDLILIDMGIKLSGYHSDMTRMLFTKSPTPKQEEIYNLVLEAQENAIKALKPGKITTSIDNIAKKIFQKQKLNENFTHSLGHGVGLEIHELPSLSEMSKDRLKPGMIVTVEPGLYFPNQFGIRIEDMIHITKKGQKNLTTVSKVIKDCILR